MHGGYIMKNTQNSYKELMLATIKETYTKYLKEKILKTLESQYLISRDNNLFSESSGTVIIDNDNISEYEKIEFALNKNDDCIKVIEDLEYDIPYKYSTLFESPNSIEEKLKMLIEKGLIIDSSNDNFTNGICSVFDLSDIIKPTYKIINDDIIALKFNQIITGFLPIEGDNKRKIKYPIVLLFHKSINIIEIRIDKIKGFLKNGDDYFYVKQIQYVHQWFESNFNLTLQPLNLQPIIDHISRKESAEVSVSAQQMNLASGSKATLDTGVNDELVLPLLGELKNFLKDNDELFKSNDKTLEILEKLNNFIIETEDTADLPWISLTWPNEKKSKIIKVKFSFNYNGQPYDLLQYYRSNAEMEGMNNVTRYLIENKREYESQNITSQPAGECNEDSL